MRLKIADILRLIRKGESQTLEFKQSFGRETLETLCAFANTDGGIVLVGVSDAGVVTGTQASKASLRDWANQIAQGLGLHPSIRTAPLEGKEVVVIEAPESHIKPVLFQGRGYGRSGSTTHQMTVEEIASAALSRVGMTWDSVPESRAKLADISGPKIRAFIAAANREKRRPVPAGTSPMDLLKKLKLVRAGKPTRAAILLFGKDPQDFYPQARLKIGRFRDETLIVDDRRIDGTLFDQVEGAMSYFREKLDTRFERTGRPQRDVIWEYPLKALREAVTNAICHRDYSGTRDSEVRLYDHEVMIWNDGDLPPELSVQALRKKHPSVPRNKQIAEIFYYAGMIEQWGSGTGMMRDECRAAGMPAPIFEQKHGLRVTFKKAVPKTLPGPSHDTSHEPPMTETTVDRVLSFCKAPRSRVEIAKELGLSSEYVRKWILPELVRSGKLRLTLPEKPQSKQQRYVSR